MNLNYQTTNHYTKTYLKIIKHTHLGSFEVKKLTRKKKILSTVYLSLTRCT